ncbi:DUF6843 domain-containing protein [Paenibacillus kandeliae]|uniref:DUF6843 domain-containing protein n=1 Tax=Paenibacillus kandeliae TaxID=3231269 RepID=UPI003459D66C
MSRKNRIGILVFAIVIIAVVSLFFVFKQERQHYIFLIPQNYTGQVDIVFEQEGAAPLKYEGKDAIVQIPDTGKVSTSDSNKTGTIDYYFIDKNGNREKIDDIQNVIHNLHTQSGNDNGKNINETIQFFVGSKDDVQ